MSIPTDPVQLGALALAPFRTDLMTWLEEHIDLDPEIELDTMVDVLAGTVGAVLAERAVQEPVATAFAADDIIVLRSQVLPTVVASTPTPDDGDDELLIGLEHDLLLLWSYFIAFLGETQRWTGSEADFTTALALLEPDEQDDADMREALATAVEEVPRQDELATLASAFPLLVADALVRLVGTGLDVPDDEFLSPEQLATVLEGLEDRLPAIEDDPAAEGELRTLEDVPWVHQVLEALLDLEVLEENDEQTRLLPGPDLPVFTADPAQDEDCLDLRREIVGRFILEDPHAPSGAFSIASALLPGAIAAAATGSQLTADVLATTLSESAAVLGDMSSVNVSELADRLEELAHFGILTPRQEPWSIAPGYIPAVALTLGDLMDGDEDEDLDGLLGEDIDITELASMLTGMDFGEQEQEQLRKLLGGQ